MAKDPKLPQGGSTSEVEAFLRTTQSTLQRQVILEAKIVEVVLAVVDSGAGVPASLSERIFEPFFSGHDGAGVGLSTARSIALAGARSMPSVTSRDRGLMPVIGVSLGSLDEPAEVSGG